MKRFSSLPRGAVLIALPMALLGGLVEPRSLAGQEVDPAPASHQHSAYAHQERSGIAALSRQEMDQLRNGEGMGLARPAELNGFPGPKHVLELSEELGLADSQKGRVEVLFSDMLDSAKRIGAEIIEAERHLDGSFRHRHADEAALRNRLDEIAGLRSELRFVHLRAHLSTTELLTGDQISAYNRLRGYDETE